MRAQNASLYDIVGGISEGDLSYQSSSVFKRELILLKGLLPKNPRCADKGEGCGDLIIKCLLSIKGILL